MRKSKNWLTWIWDDVSRVVKCLPSASCWKCGEPWKWKKKVFLCKKMKVAIGSDCIQNMKKTRLSIMNHTENWVSSGSPLFCCSC